MSDDLRAIVDQQAEDEGLWFVAQTAPEAYLQQELRRLHAAIEATSEPAPDVEAAWEALNRELPGRFTVATERLIARHRPRIEAALYAGFVQRQLDNPIAVEEAPDGSLAALRHAPDLDVERLEAAIRGAWRNLTADDFWMDDAGQPYPDSMAVLIAREYAALRDKP